jgi:hypothetical protein
MAGCLLESGETSISWYERAGNPQGPSGADLIQTDIVLLEQRVGDPYINESIWSLADEQLVVQNQKAIITENGFRVGQICGITPPDLQDLMTSERSNPSPRRKQTHSGHTFAVDLGPVAERCQFQMEQGSKAISVDLKRVQCSFEITASLQDDGKTLLHMTPRLAPDQADGLRGIRSESLNWIRRLKQPDHAYNQLSWDVALAPNEYLIVGGRYDQPDSLGYQCFIRPDEAMPVQRILILRTTRVEPESALEDIDPKRNSMPLALQAAWTTNYKNKTGN